MAPPTLLLAAVGAAPRRCEEACLCGGDEKTFPRVFDVGDVHVDAAADVDAYDDISLRLATRMPARICRFSTPVGCLTHAHARAVDNAVGEYSVFPRDAEYIQVVYVKKERKRKKKRFGRDHRRMRF